MPGRINGYDRTAFAHLAVAVAVAGGAARAPGSESRRTARALDLDFVPLLKERYDLVIPRVHYESSLLEPMLAILREASFRAEVEGLGGYDVSQMGQVIAEAVASRAAGDAVGAAPRSMRWNHGTSPVRGVVQGVGFRPFVYRLAHEHWPGRLGAQPSGAWRSRSKARPARWTRSSTDLRAKAPPLARIEEIEAATVPR